MPITTSPTIVGTLTSTTASGRQFVLKPTNSNAAAGFFVLHLAGIYQSVTFNLQKSTDQGTTWLDSGLTLLRGPNFVQADTNTVWRLKLSAIGGGAVKYYFWQLSMANWPEQDAHHNSAYELALMAQTRPYITGTAGVAGNTLTVRTPGLVASTYQWRNDGSNIGGATTASYNLQAGDIGHQIDCVVNSTFISIPLVG